MGYVDGKLLANEQIQYAGTTSVWYLLPHLVVGLALLPLFGLGLIFWIVSAVRYVTAETVITDRRIMARHRFGGHQTIELDLLQADSIRIDQGWLGRVFNFGSIVISGSGKPQPPIPGIRQPLAFRQRFLEIQEQAADLSAGFARSALPHPMRAAAAG